jgi:hypothetical protein
VHRHANEPKLSPPDTRLSVVSGASLRMRRGSGSLSYSLNASLLCALANRARAHWAIAPRLRASDLWKRVKYCSHRGARVR